MRGHVLLLIVLGAVGWALAGGRAGADAAPPCTEIVAWPSPPVDCAAAGGVFQRHDIGGVGQAVCVFSDASDTEAP